MTDTANGKAALSLFEDDRVVAIASRELKSAGQSQRPLSDFLKEIEDIRETGIAWDLDEHTQGISAAGFAFQDPVGLVYAISVPVPSHRFAGLRESLATQLLGAREAVAKLV